MSDWRTHEKGTKAVNFLNRLPLTHEGVTTRNWLRGWQEELIRKIEGTVKDDGKRLFRKVFIGVGRKSGKTYLIAALCLYYLFTGPGNQEIYSAAGSQDQAARVFKYACEIIRAHPDLERNVTIYESKTDRRIVFRKTGSYYQALSADGKTKNGLSPSVIICDELHVWPKRDLYATLRTGQGARSEPLLIHITTAGNDKKSLCWELWEHSLKVQADPTYDPTWLSVIYAADDEDDWTSEDVWRKAMPALGDFTSIEQIREEFALAKKLPNLEAEFRQYYLNQWISNTTSWIRLEDWQACKVDFEAEDLRGMECTLGIDMSRRVDITSVVAVFNMPDGKYRVLPFFWVPAERAALKEQTDKVPYSIWENSNHVYLTPGSGVSYADVKAKVLQLREEYNVTHVTADQWNSNQLIQELMDEGLTCTFFRQGFVSFNKPCKELEALVLEGKIEHNGNPCLDWMMGNVRVDTDPAGNMKPNKERSTDKIDGVVAMLMALGVALDDPVSYFDDIDPVRNSIGNNT